MDFEAPEKGRRREGGALIETPPRFSHALMLDRDRKRNVAALWSAGSAKGVVATAHYLATAAGVGALERGGNAIDAAVTAALALGVCEPAGSGLGGMAMMLVHLEGSRGTFAISGACRAPIAATPEAVAGTNRYRGYRAVAVPTNLSVLRYVLTRYGTMKPAAVLEPAIELADTGFPLTSLQQRNTAEYTRPLKEGNASAVFLDRDGEPFPAGFVFRQPALSKTLRRLASAGLEDFYRGEIATEICRDMRAHEGFVDREDLRAALEVQECLPLKAAFAGQDVLSLGPPAGGLALLQMLRMASFLSPDERDMNRGEGVSRVAAIISRARTDRRKYRLRTLADGAGDAIELLDDGYARRAVDAALAEASMGVDANTNTQASGETTHLSVMDAAGNAVSLTQSIERSFGAAVATPTLGFLYNGYLRAFKVENERHPHYLRAGAPARSNAAPTIVLRDGRAHACVGSTGSERMTSGIFEVLLRLANGSAPFDAVHSPRLHCTPERKVIWEEDRFPHGLRDALLRHGFTVEAVEPYSFKMGGLHLAVRQDGQCVGVAEPRRDGAAGAPLAIAKPG